MMRAWPFIAVACWLVSAFAHAQAVPPPPAGSQLQLVIEIDPAIAEPLRSRMKGAIAAELSAQVLDAPAPGAGTLRIVRGANQELQLSYTAAPAPIARSVPWSADEQVAIRDVALMAANLVRDQTVDLLPPVPAESASGPAPAAGAQPPPATPPAPGAAAALDSERPPDFAPPQKLAPAQPLPPNLPRMQIVAVFAPALTSAANVDGEVEQRPSTGIGLQGRFDLPLAPQLSLGAGFGLYDFPDFDSAGPIEGATEIEVKMVTDASAWLRAHMPLGSRGELYLALGAGPSLQYAVERQDESGSENAPPALGLNASLLAGASLKIASHFGLALELGAQYHLMRSRQVDSSMLVFHALHVALQFGALWVFDA